MKDTARVLGRMFDGIEYRGFAQEDVETLGRYAGVPVWNGLTDQWHPTQMLADMLDHARPRGQAAVEEISYCYLGDARNNTAHSLLVTGALLGHGRAHRRPGAAVARQRRCASIAEELGRGIGRPARSSPTTSTRRCAASTSSTPTSGSRWASRPRQWGERIDLLLPYQVNPTVIAADGQPGREVHALPAGACTTARPRSGESCSSKRASTRSR